MAAHDHIVLSSQLPVKPPSPPAWCAARVMQSSEVLELLIEILVLQVTVLNEVLSQWDVHSSSLTNYMCSAAAFSVDVCHTTM